MTVEIRFRMRFRDLQDFAEREFGGVHGLRQHLDKHPNDSGRVLLYMALTQRPHRPDEVLTFTRAYLGAAARGPFSLAKLDILQCLMSNPGINVRELARQTGRSPSTVSQHIRELRRLGLVTTHDEGAGKPTTIEPVPQEIDIRLRRGGARAR